MLPAIQKLGTDCCTGVPDPPQVTRKHRSYIFFFNSVQFETKETIRIHVSTIMASRQQPVSSCDLELD